MAANKMDAMRELLKANPAISNADGIAKLKAGGIDIGTNTYSNYKNAIKNEGKNGKAKAKTRDIFNVPMTTNEIRAEVTGVSMEYRESSSRAISDFLVATQTALQFMTAESLKKLLDTIVSK